MPNQEQIKSILQLLLGAGGPLAALIMSYGVPPDKMSLWTNLIVAIAPPLIGGIWAILDRTHKATITAAAAIPGVEQVMISPSATDGAKAAADDKALTNVTR